MINPFVTIGVIWAAFIAMAFWESSVEGRNAWQKKKVGWRFKIFGIWMTQYHFFLAWVTLPLFTLLPLIIYGWDFRLFGILVSAFSSGLVIEDFMWYVVDPVVKFKEFFSSFSDYYPWIKFGKKKIIPTFYLVGVLIAVLSWYFIWR